MEIEHDKSVDESQKVPQTTQRAASGRKPAHASRATELRQKLIIWKQTPESMRQSLRELARELGTNHQILSYHLKGLEAEEKAKQIRARRYLTLAPGREKVPETTRGAQ